MKPPDDSLLAGPFSTPTKNYMSYVKRYFSHHGIQASVHEGGEGYPVLLLHGSGPGASTAGNWRRVLEPLSTRYRVHAMDLIGFGESGRKPEMPYFDLNLWQEQCQALIDQIPGDEIGVIGHSISGVLAFRLAANNPRIRQIMTTGTIGRPFTVGAAAVRVWTFPKNRAELRQVAEILIHDKSVIDDGYMAAREKILFEDGSYRAYFEAMFAGDKQKFADAAIVSPEQLSHVTCKVLMLHGRDDVAFPPSQTLDIADHIPQADVMLIARCSHSVAMEHPDKFLAAARMLFG